MDEICGLKLYLSYVDMPEDFFLEIASCADHVIFVNFKKKKKSSSEMLKFH
jgi:hypothetical protein